MSTLNYATIVCPYGRDHETEIVVASDFEPHRYECDDCGGGFWVQQQYCTNCRKYGAVADQKAFEMGVYACAYCRMEQKLVPWYPAKKSKMRDTPFLVKVFKKLLGKRGPVLAHDSSLTCPDCQTDSIFWEIGNGARKLCSLCGKEL